MPKVITLASGGKEASSNPQRYDTWHRVPTQPTSAFGRHPPGYGRRKDGRKEGDTKKRFEIRTSKAILLRAVIERLFLLHQAAGFDHFSST